MRDWPRIRSCLFRLSAKKSVRIRVGGKRTALSTMAVPHRRSKFAPQALVASAVRTPEQDMRSGGFCVCPHWDSCACLALLAKRADRHRAWNHARPVLHAEEDPAAGRSSFQKQTLREQCARDRSACPGTRTAGASVGTSCGHAVLLRIACQLRARRSVSLRDRW
jgi:hypothetical protein